MATAIGGLFVVVSYTGGTGLPGVNVTVSGLGAPPQSQVTDPQGQARFLALPPGSYSLTAAMEGFNTVNYPNVTIRSLCNTEIDITMSPAIADGT